MNRQIQRAILPLFLLGMTVSARADAKFDRYFGHGDTCYARIYDAPHLKSHPHQNVRKIELSFAPKNPDGKANTAGHFELGFAVIQRHPAGAYGGSAICEAKGGGFSCYLEGDQGLFTLRTAGADLQLDVIPRGNERISLEGETDFTQFGSDDVTFILRKDALGQCKDGE